ncbi:MULTISPECIES: hypothetical protein [Trichocoleus]|uniref:Uncharacterized protein n=1 Tax=Trichocoleus desertorum GB2-A4 TaxID=2933944 RepID=A0ABV0JDG1_9CYAN|nr:hypothetical protein [Trichocoleus sp. FACHB-46]MBD1861218.1 hypothetical protein [Trichocoleus sp. FACHB-46]
MMVFSRQAWGQLIGPSLVALACAALIGATQLPQLRRISTKTSTAPVAVLERELAAEKVRLNLLEKLPTFGFSNLLADWVFLNFLQYFGDDEAREKTGYELSPEYFEVVLSRDPYFLDGYFFLSGSTALYAAMPERSVALMNQGLKQLSPKAPPKSYYVWRYKGIDELLFLGDAKAAQYSFAMAAEWASTYTDPESQSIATFSRRTSQFLARNPRSKFAQVAAWSQVLGNATDDRTRQIAVKRIRALGGDVITGPDGSSRIRPPARD